MSLLKKILAVTLSISMLPVISMGVKAEDSDAVADEVYEYTLNPELYATIITDDTSSNYISKKQPMTVTVNQAYGNTELNARFSAIVTSYDVPLKNALTKMEPGIYLMPGNDSGDRHVPFYFDLNAVPDTVEKTAGKYVHSSVEENAESNAKYDAWLTYLKQYWRNTATDWTLAYKIQDVSGEKIHYFDVTDTAVPAIKESDSSYITFGTGYASDYYYNYRLKTRSGYIHRMKLTYSVADILSYVNSANAENIFEVIKNIGKAGVLDETTNGYEAYTTLTDSAQREVANKLLAKIQETPFTSLADIGAAYDEAMVLNTLTAVISPENYALVVATDDCGYYSDQGSGYNKLALKAYVNTLYPSNTELHSQMVSMITDFKLDFRNAITNVKAKYFVTKADQSGYIPIYYNMDKLSLDTAAGTYTKDDETTGTNYAEWLEFVNNYWTTGNELTTAWPCAGQIKNTTANGTYDFDITTGVLDDLRNSESGYITLATGRVTYYYNNMRLKLNLESYIPELTITYTESDVMQTVNTTAEENVADLLSQLHKSGLSGSTGESYFALDDNYRAVAEAAVFEGIKNEGYDSFEDFMNAYNTSVNEAIEAIKDNPALYVNFDDKMPVNTVGNPEIAESFNGTNSLKIMNEYGKTAQQYAELGNYDFGEKDFSIVFWMKAENRGVNGLGSSITGGTEVDFSNTTATNGGVVLSNRDYSTPGNTGFSMLAMNRAVDFAINTKFSDSTAVNVDTLQTPVDSRWHQIAYVVDRDGNAVTYVDDKAVSTVDISAFTGTLNGAEGAKLILGADGLGQYGMNKGEFDEIRIYSQVMSEAEIQQMYYINSLSKANNDISGFLESEVSGDYSAENISELNEKYNSSVAYENSYDWGNSAELKTKLDEINTYFDAFLNKASNINGAALFVTDVHINNATDGVYPNSNFIKAMTEYEELGIDIDTLVMGGDNAESGAWYQDDLFDKFLDQYWLPTGLNIAAARGNHDYPVYEGAYRYDADGNKFTPTEEFLREEFEDRISPYVDKSLSQNKSLLDTDGNLDQPYYYQTDGTAHYIVLDNFTPSLHNMDSTQLNWLDDTLKSVSGDGKPIFVVQHMTTGVVLPHTDPRFDLTEEVAAKLNTIIKKYDNVFVLCGHYHLGFGTATVGPELIDDSYYILSGPTLGEKNELGYMPGSGYYMFISDDEVTFRARDFENQVWVRDYDFSLPLKAATKAQLDGIELLDSTDETVKYETLSAAAGKNVKINASAEFGNTSSCTAILAIYSDDGLIYTDAESVTAENEISFTADIPANAKELKVMLWSNLKEMKPICKAVNMN